MTADAPSPTVISRFVLGLLAVALAAHFTFSLAGWNEPIVGHHAQRQTQTAISTYWIAQGGPWLSYETPVLGPPWAMPMEFPVYQLLVAGLTKVFPIPLDQAGRTVSLIFFYVLLIPVYVLVRAAGSSRTGARATLILMLISPNYIFWSRTFMIESVSLCLALAYLALVVSFLRQGRIKLGVAALLCGSLAALSKITTFAPAWGGAALVGLGYFVRPQLFSAAPARSLRRLCGLALLLAVPIGLTKWWTNYADAVKALNPNAAFLSSDRLHEWNFGTLHLRLTGEFWRTIWWEITERAYASKWTLAGVPLLLCLPRRRPWLLLGVALACACSGFLVFANLYQVHDYYIYGTAVYFLVIGGLAFGGSLELPGWRGWLACSLLTAMTFFSIRIYAQGGYYLYQRQPDPAMADVGRFIGRLAPENQPILILGEHYNSTLPYFSARRGLTLGPGAALEAYAQAAPHLPPGQFFGLLVVDLNDHPAESEIGDLVRLAGFQPAPCAECGGFRFYASLRLPVPAGVPPGAEFGPVPPVYPSEATGEHPVEWIQEAGRTVISTHPPATLTYHTDPHLRRLILALGVRPVKGHGILSDGFRISIVGGSGGQPLFTHRFSAEEVRDPSRMHVDCAFPAPFDGTFRIIIDEDPAHTTDFDWVFIKSLLLLRADSRDGT